MMAINDFVEIQHSKKWGYVPIRGREAFYNEDRDMITFETFEEAAEWVHDTLKSYLVTHPDTGEPDAPKKFRGVPVPDGQLGFDEL